MSRRFLFNGERRTVKGHLRWEAYHLWHGIVHVGLGRYRWFCHYCAERDRHLLGNRRVKP